MDALKHTDLPIGPEGRTIMAELLAPHWDTLSRSVSNELNDRILAMAPTNASPGVLAANYCDWLVLRCYKYGTVYHSLQSLGRLDVARAIDAALDAHLALRPTVGPALSAADDEALHKLQDRRFYLFNKIDAKQRRAIHSASLAQMHTLEAASLRAQVQRHREALAETEKALTALETELLGEPRLRGPPGSFGAACEQMHPAWQAQPFLRKMHAVNSTDTVSSLSAAERRQLSQRLQPYFFGVAQDLGIADFLVACVPLQAEPQVYVELLFKLMEERGTTLLQMREAVFRGTGTPGVFAFDANE